MESLIGFPGSVIARRGRVRDPFPFARVRAGAVEGFRAKRPSTAADARAMWFSRTPGELGGGALSRCSLRLPLFATFDC